MTQSYLLMVPPVCSSLPIQRTVLSLLLRFHVDALLLSSLVAVILLSWL